MSDGLIYIICILLIAVIGITIYTLSQIKKLKNNDEMSQLDKQLGAVLMLMKQNSGSNAEEFERNRRETANSLNQMTEKLDTMTRQNYETLIKLNKDMTESLNLIRTNSMEQNEKQTRVVDAAIAKMQESNEKKLDQMRATVDEKLTSTLATRLDSSFKTVSEQLENVYKSLGEMKELSTGVTTNVTALNRVLTNVKTRGTWAEIQLEGILDQTIPNMYVKNYSPKAN